ncbi:MAG: signal peptide peptidase SppA [Suipraeoptans sp.]
MKKKQIIALIVTAVVFIVVGASSVLTNTWSKNILSNSTTELLTGGMQFTAPTSDYIAVVNVVGTIQEQTDSSSLLSSTEGYMHTSTMEYIDRLMDDSNNKGILLYVDSPGGTVYESEELYDKLMEYKDKTERPIWDYMAHYAASGGYMTSVTADKIYANKNTTTGSIGVIMSGYDMTGLYEKLGMKYFSITSGEFKDSTQMTDDQIAIYQDQVDEMYQNFVDKISKGRDMSDADVKKLADGRTYTATQAVENGLIDGISTLDKVKDEMGKKLGTDTFYEPSMSSSGFLSGLLSDVQKIVPKSEAQVLVEEASKIESGVPMYYAEQLK